MKKWKVILTVFVPAFTFYIHSALATDAFQVSGNPKQGLRVQINGDATGVVSEIVNFITKSPDFKKQEASGTGCTDQAYSDSSQAFTIMHRGCGGASIPYYELAMDMVPTDLSMMSTSDKGGEVVFNGPNAMLLYNSMSLSLTPVLSSPALTVYSGVNTNCRKELGSNGTGYVYQCMLGAKYNAQ